MKKRKIKTGSKRRVLGIDQSLNESAFQLLIDGKQVDYAFFTSVKKDAVKYTDNAIYVPPKLKGSTELIKFNRLNFLRSKFLDLIKNRFRPDIAMMEGYAYGVRSSSTFQLGELGGLLRLILGKICPFFVIDPDSLKMYATGKGNSDKTAMVVACLKQWEKLDFTDFGKVSHNLADAYCLAQLMTELDSVIMGKIALTDLKNSTQKIFQRTTKTYPESLISQHPLGEIEYD